jgi:hypothetical protein
MSRAGTPACLASSEAVAHACNYRNLTYHNRVKSSPRLGPRGKGAKFGMQRAFRASTKLKFACPSERIPVFFLFIWTCFALIIIAISYRHYIILVYRAGGLYLLRDTPHPGSRPRTYMPPAPRMGGHERSGQGRVLVVPFCFVCGDGRKVSKKRCQHIRSVHLRIAHTQRYVVWYQRPSVYTCRDTYVAFVEKRKQNSQMSHKSKEKHTPGRRTLMC